MKKYPLALFIGRFQPFHNGHLFSLEKALEVGERVVIGIGSSQEQETESNPWDYDARRCMIEDVIKGTDLLPGVSRKVEIVAVPDFPTDEEWVAFVTALIQDEGYTIHDAVAVGNNPWTNGVLGKAGFVVVETGLHNRDELEGVKIREMIRKGDERWKLRVPEEVARQIDVIAV